MGSNGAGAQLLPVLSDLSGQIGFDGEPTFRDGLADALRGIGGRLSPQQNRIAALARQCSFR